MPRRAPTADATDAAAAASSPVVVTVLHTTDGHGWLLPLAENGKVRGGAAAILGLWTATERHCAGVHPPGRRRAGLP